MPCGTQHRFQEQLLTWGMFPEAGVGCGQWSSGGDFGVATVRDGGLTGHKEEEDLGKACVMEEQAQ